MIFVACPALMTDPMLPFVGFTFQEENARCLKAAASPQDSETQEREDR